MVIIICWKYFVSVFHVINWNKSDYLSAPQLMMKNVKLHQNQWPDIKIFHTIIEMLSTIMLIKNLYDYFCSRINHDDPVFDLKAASLGLVVHVVIISGSTEQHLRSVQIWPVKSWILSPAFEPVNPVIFFTLNTIFVSCFTWKWPNLRVLTQSSKTENVLSEDQSCVGTWALPGCKF